MILRRVTEHVKAQNWFAVAIDFVIVVAGVFLGIQIGDWNTARQERLSEAQYLERFADEIELTILHIQQEREFADMSVSAIENFTTRLFDAPTSDEDLLTATNSYLTNGVFFAKINPNRTTFDDLITTGNFNIISDEAIRSGLMALHGQYDEAVRVIEKNIDWAQQHEDRVYFEFDAFRFDARTKVLFDDAPNEELARDVRENRDLLRRHAALHYWLKVRSIELYDDMETEAQAVLELINAERGSR